MAIGGLLKSALNQEDIKAEEAAFNNTEAVHPIDGGVHKVEADVAGEAWRQFQNDKAASYQKSEDSPPVA